MARRKGARVTVVVAMVDQSAGRTAARFPPIPFSVWATAFPQVIEQFVPGFEMLLLTFDVADPRQV
jgi:hypothetical protein